MATYVKTLKDGDDNIIYPQSKTEAIFDNNDRNLNVALEKRIVISSSTPSEQIVGDLWYREITEL